MFVGCRGFCVKVRFWVKKFTFPLILFKCIHFPLAFSIFHFHCHSLQFLLCCLFVLERVLGEGRGGHWICGIYWHFPWWFSNPDAVPESFIRCFSTLLWQKKKEEIMAPEKVGNFFADHWQIKNSRKKLLNE